MCETGIKGKFDENPDLKTVLLKTGNKIIVECSLDETWGTGIPINDLQALKQNRWINQGILGEILEELRNNYSREETSTEGTEDQSVSSMETSQAPD